MANNLFITTTEARSGKSAISLRIMELLIRKVGRMGFFQPLIDAKAPGDDNETHIDSRKPADKIISTRTTMVPTKIFEYGLLQKVRENKQPIVLPEAEDERILAASVTLSHTTMAPLHNPANLTGIRGAGAIFPDTAQVAVFDTAFHQTLPKQAYMYALPRRISPGSTSVAVLVVPTDEELEIARQTRKKVLE